MTQLAGHFDEYAFFPFLESIGLDPRMELTPTLQPAADAFKTLLPQIAHDGRTAEWRVLLSVTYGQTVLIAPPSKSRDQLLDVFNAPALAEYVALGDGLVKEILAAQNEDPNEAENRLKRCVHEHLKISETAAVVKRLFSRRCKRGMPPD